MVVALAGTMSHFTDYLTLQELTEFWVLFPSRYRKSFYFLGRDSGGIIPATR